MAKTKEKLFDAASDFPENTASEAHKHAINKLVHHSVLLPICLRRDDTGQLDNIVIESYKLLVICHKQTL